MDLYTLVEDYHPFLCKIWEWGKRMGSSQIGDGLIKSIQE